MMVSHALWDALSSGHQVTPDTPDRRQALHRYNLAMFAERFGWTPDVVENLDTDVYNDLLLICSIIDYKRKKSSSS